MQSSEFAPGSPIIVTANSGEASGWGVDFLLGANVTERLDVSLSAGYVDAEFDTTTAAHLKGDPMDYVPELTGALSGSYHFDWAPTLPGVIRLDYQYQEKFHVTLRNFADSVVESDSLSFLNARVGIEKERWQLYLEGKNLLDEGGVVYPAAGVSPLPSRPQPLSVGLRFRFQYLAGERAMARATRKSDATFDYPDARVQPVTKTIGGITFEDPYAWLQEDSEEALNWQWQQDEVAASYARNIPGFGALTERIRATQGDVLAHALGGAPRRLGGKWFRLAVDESGSQALRVSDSISEPGRSLVNAKFLAEAAGDGHPRFITWWEPSPNAAYVAFAVIAGGDMTGTWRVVDVRSGKLLAIEVPALAYTGATPGWLPDESGFYVNDRTDDGKHRLHFVVVADGGNQRPEVIFDDSAVPRNVAGLTPHVSRGGRYVVAVAQPHEHIAYMLGDLASGEWRPFLPDGYHSECDGVWLDDETYIARVHGESPRGRVVAIDVTTSKDPSTWREIVPASDAVLRGVTVIDGRVAVCEIKDVSVRFRLVHLDGTPDRILPLEGPGNSRIAFVMRRFEISEALTLDYETFAQPPVYYHYDVGAGRLESLGTPPYAIEGLEVSQRFARSSDGTQVPYYLVHGKVLDVSQPQRTLVTGYGGFNVALLPSYLRHIRFFVEAGGVFVVANLRGGAEFGKDWHDGGRLHKKQNTFDDLFAVAEDLISTGITKPELMAMQGGSNGGLLAGVAIVQRPDLWRAVVPVVPIFDQLEPYPPGPEYNAIRAIWYEDYGDPEKPEDARVMFGYSPYHNVRDGIRYPAVYQVFGEKDLGCRPFHGRKFTARLQSASTSGRPILLRVWKDVGHGSADVEKGPPQTAEWLAFVMQELGMNLPRDDD